MPLPRAKTTSSEPVLRELAEAEVSSADLRFIASVVDEPNAPELARQKYEGERQRKLLVAGGFAAAAATAFVGDANTIALLHGALTHAADVEAVGGMTGAGLLFGALTPVYYFRLSMDDRR